jgi:hypothetical protein
MSKPTGIYEGKEDGFQQSAIRLIRIELRAAGYDPKCAVHIPNGGERHPAVAAKMKAAGVVPGYPDIMVFVPEVLPPINRRREIVIPRCGLALELKVWPNKPTPNQAHVHELLRWSGWRVVTCWSLDTVISEIKQYLDRR